MKRRQNLIVIGIVLFVGLAAAFVPGRLQAQEGKPRRGKAGMEPRRYEPPKFDASEAREQPSLEGFAIVRSETGTECRQLTAREASEMRVNERHTEMRALGGSEPARVQQQQGLRITLRGTTQLDQAPTARAAFQRAAARWQGIIKNPLTIIIDVDYGTTRFGTPYPSPNIIGATSEPILTAMPYAALRQALIELSTNPLQTAATTALPANALPTSLGNATSFRSTTTQFRVLELLDPVANPETEMLPPPAIGFNSAIPFDFDPSDGIDADKIDFEATAVHEIGHVIGFISNVGFKETSPTFPNVPTHWDFFRFASEGQSLATIGTAQRPQVTGGTQVYFAGDAEYGLSTGDPNANNGDRRQASHWKDESFTGQYVGIMDPTGTDGQPDYVTAADVSAVNLFGYDVNADAQVFELPSVDDSTREESISLNNGIVVNRFTPSRYPSTLHGIRLLVPQGVSEGQSLRVVAFVDANRTGQPPANPAFVADRTLNLPAIPRGRFLDITFSTPPTINAGDVYIGVQAATFLVAADNNGRQYRRSFLSTNNGGSFQPLQNVANAPVNFIARAIFSNRFGATPAPALGLLSPSAAAPGSGEFTLTLQGSGFRQNSVVRFKDVDRATTFLSGGELRAQIPAADIASAGTAKVTVFTAGAGESAALTFNITGDNPAPAIARLSPNVAAVGAPATALSVFGDNFTAGSVVRLNGMPLTTVRVSSTQLTTSLPASALAAAGENKISVATPAPGGGASGELTFTVVACSFALSSGSQAGSSLGGGSGVVLSTGSACNWMAASDQPWITFTNPANGAGMGRFVINFNIAPNTGVAPRTGNITVGGQTLALTQYGRATGVSAASFTGNTAAAESIIALFGGGLANATEVAQSQPLPTTLAGTRVVVLDSRGTQRPAPLFFVSPGQINFLIPAGTAVGNANLQVFSQTTAPIADGRVIIAATAPALFAANANGQGVAAAVVLRVKPDNSQSFEPVARFDAAQNRIVPVPIDFGPETDKLFLLLYGTGIRGRTALSAVALKLGDITVPVSFAGPVEGLSGLDQINAELSRTLIGKGEVTASLTVGAAPANAVTLTFK